MAQHPLHPNGYNSRVPPPAPPLVAPHAPAPLAAHAGPNKENPFPHPHTYAYPHAHVEQAKQLPAMPRVDALHPAPAHTYTPPHHRPLPPSPTKTTATATVNHYTRPLGGNARAAQQSQQAEPTMVQLLASQGTAPAHYASRGGAGDVTMGNATGVLSWRKGQGFKEWEKIKLNSPEVKRKADVAQLCASLAARSLRSAPNWS